MNRLAIVVALVVSVALVVGCGRTKTVVVPGSRTTVTTDKTAGGERTITMNTKDGGKVTVESKKTITEAELGVPVYPGAESLMNSKAEGKEGGVASSYENHTLSTTDSQDKVAGFYKARLKDVESSSTIDQGDHKMTMFAITKGKVRTVVQIMDDPKEKKTMIVVTRAVN